MENIEYVLTPDIVNGDVIAVLKQAQNGVFGGSLNFEEAFFDALSRRLVVSGFRKFDKANSKYPKDCKYRKEQIKESYENKDPHLIFQPEGSQRSPDIRIVYNSNSLDIEVKSTLKGTVMWNCGLPKENNIYITIKGQTMDVTFAMGQDIFLPEHYKIAKEGHRKIADGLAAKLIARLKEINSPITYYPRPMYVDFRNWFDDNLPNTPIPNRKDREENVLKYIKSFQWGLE